MTLTKLLFSLFITFTSLNYTAAQSSTTATSRYQTALNSDDAKTQCSTFSQLAKDSQFLLKDLAKIRHAELCAKAPRWKNLSKEISQPWLQKNLFNSWYDFELLKGNPAEAYRLQQKHSKLIRLDRKQFETLAEKALKAKLTKKEIRTLKKQRQKKSARFIKKPKKSQYLKVAKDYRRARNFEKALYYYRLVINDAKMTYNQRWSAFRGARATYKLERWKRMKNYIKSSRQWAYFLNSKYKWSARMTQLHHDANIEYIRTLWTERGQTQAIKELNRLKKQMTGRHSLQTVYWLLGRMAEESEIYTQAVNWLTKSSKEKSLGPRDQQRVLWSLAWNQRRIQKFSDSQQTLAKLKKHPDITAFAKSKYLYWEAENLRSMKKISEANKALERLTAFDLYGYYGALAYRKLGRPFPTPVQTRLDQEGAMSFFNDDDQKVLQALIAVNEMDVAKDFVFKKVNTSRKWGTTKWVQYLSLLQLAGAQKNSFLRYHRLKPKIQMEILEDHPYLLFPQPHLTEVQAAAKLTKVSPALIYSIMKQESGFDVKARSHADAFGLLQLIPQNAKKSAAAMPSVKYKKPYDLYKPEVIIPLGANTLNQLFSKFNSNFILSVASYNASEKAVKGWIKTRYKADPVTFIEDIPYEETKGYVKLVMRNYIAYNRFDQSKGPFVFPEVCLKGLEQFK